MERVFSNFFNTNVEQVLHEFFRFLILAFMSVYHAIQLDFLDCNEITESGDPKVKGHNLLSLIRNLFVQKRLSDVVGKFNGEERRREFPKYIIDAQHFGNVSRFLNHSCDPNVFIQCVLSSHDDFSLPRIAMFAADHIHPLEVHLLA